VRTWEGDCEHGKAAGFVVVGLGAYIELLATGTTSRSRLFARGCGCGAGEQVERRGRAGVVYREGADALCLKPVA